MATFNRARWLLIPIVLILVVGGYAGWKYFSKWETTDDAQVDGHINAISARIRPGGNKVNVRIDLSSLGNDSLNVGVRAADYQHYAVRRVDGQRQFLQFLRSSRIGN